MLGSHMCSWSMPTPTGLVRTCLVVPVQPTTGRQPTVASLVFTLPHDTTSICNYLGMQTRHARYTAIRPCESFRQAQYSMEMTEKLRTGSAASLAYQPDTKADHPITVERMESSKACTLSISPLGQLAHSSGSVDHQSTSLELWCINGTLQSKVRDGRYPSEATFPSPADIAF